MRPEQELQILIEEQRRDDTGIVWPERGVDLSLDTKLEGNEGIGGVMGDSFGVVYDFAGEADGDPDDPIVISFMPHRRGRLLGAGIHGTENGYTNRGCRCPRCTDAHRIFYKERRARKRREGHGVSRNLYVNRGCRCQLCRKADRTYRRALRGTKTNRTCKHCHRPFSFNGTPRLYCSDTCKQRAYFGRPRITPLVCHCGARFSPRSLKQKHCSPTCTRRAADRAYRARLGAPNVCASRGRMTTCEHEVRSASPQDFEIGGA